MFHVEHTGAVERFAESYLFSAIVPRGTVRLPPHEWLTYLGV